MQEGSSDNRDVLEQAKLELAELGERVAALLSLIDAALGEAQPDEGSRARHAMGESAARSIASHMALSGHSRAGAERRLRGSVPNEELRAILDDLYGTSGSPLRPV